jgi:hypothetical protein
MIWLTLDNYLYWRTQVDPILRSNLLFGFVDGSLPCPPEELAVPVKDGTPASTIDNPKYSAWHQQDQSILFAIVSSLSEGVIGMVMMIPTSQEAWETHIQVRYLHVQVSLSAGGNHSSFYCCPLKHLLLAVDDHEDVPVGKQL